MSDAVYFDEYLTVDGRSEWRERARKRFADVDLVFMDPDIGLLVDSVGKRSARSVKYAFADMKNSKWGQCGVCRLYPEDADVAFTVYY